MNRKAGFEQPKTEIEKLLTKVWEEALDRKEIGIHDNFFALGGDSFKAILMIGSLEGELKSSFTFSDLVRYQTINELCKNVLVKKDSDTSDDSDILPAPKADYYDLLVNLEVPIILQNFNIPANREHCILTKEFEYINQEAFEKAVHDIISRHEILRTTYVQVNGEIKQKINSIDGVHYTIDYVDLRKSKEKISWNTIITQSKAIVFDLEKGPFFDIKVYQFDDKKSVVLFTIDHILFDFMSMEILLNEMDRLYQAYLNGNEIKLPELKIQFKDFCMWQRRAFQDENNPDKLFWHQLFRNKPSMKNLSYCLSQNPAVKQRTDSYCNELRRELESILKRKLSETELKQFYGKFIKIRQSENGREFESRLMNDIYQGLLKLSIESRFSITNILIACYHILLYRITGNRDNIFTSVTMIRDQKELKNMLGYLFNLILLRNEMDEEREVNDFIKMVHENHLLALKHKTYTIDYLLYELDIPLDMGSINFNFINPADRDMGKNEFNRIHKKRCPGPNPDIQCNIRRYHNGIHINWFYNADIFTPEQIEYLFNELLEIITVILKDPKMKIKELKKSVVQVLK